MSWNWLRVVLMSVAALAATASVRLPAADEKSPEPPKKVKEMLGKKATTILAKATKVEAFRIKPGRTDKAGDGFIAGYPITAKGKKLDEAFAAKVTKALFDEKTYGGAGARCFEPGVAFRVWNGKEAVEVIICFRCTNFEVQVSGAKKDGDETEQYGFGPGLEPFLALAKEAFPDDREIQGLKGKDGK
jgi:hypothetical protein